MDAERPGVHTSTVGSSTSAASSNPSSLAGTSTLNCSESSGPRSEYSSATSHSDDSDTEVPPTNCSASTTVLPSTPPNNSLPGSRTIPRSTPQQPCRTPSGTSSRAREPVRRAAIRTSSHWLSKNTIGLVSLAATLSSLIFLGVRTYKLEVSQAINAALGACTSLIQANLTTLEASSSECKKSIAQGVIESPYHLGKRALRRAVRTYSHEVSQAVLSACTSLIQANLTTLEASSSECKKIIAQGVTNSPYHLGKRVLRRASSFVFKAKRAELHAFSNSFYRALSISRTFWLVIPAFATILLGAILLALARRRSRDGEPLQSAARNDVLVTWAKGKETETVAEQDVRVVKHNADHDHYPGQIRRRFQLLQAEDDKGTGEVAAWETINSSFSSSSETLAGSLTGSDPRKVSITDRSANETHEGLIELKTTGDNKTYFDPETGEFIHLTPWKSTHKDDDESKDSHSGNAATKKDTARAIARMATGIGAYAGGKGVDDALAREIADAENKRIAQRAGDCLAGLVTNERPSGRPQTV